MKIDSIKITVFAAFSILILLLSLVLAAELNAPIPEKKNLPEIWFCKKEEKTRITEPEKLVFNKGGKKTLTLCLKGYGVILSKSGAAKSTLKFRHVKTGQEFEIVRDKKYFYWGENKIYFYQINLFEKDFGPEKTAENVDILYNPTKTFFPEGEYEVLLELDFEDKNLKDKTITLMYEGKPLHFTIGKVTKYYIAGPKERGDYYFRFALSDIDALKKQGFPIDYDSIAQALSVNETLRVIKVEKVQLNGEDVLVLKGVKRGTAYTATFSFPNKPVFSVEFEIEEDEPLYITKELK